MFAAPDRFIQVALGVFAAVADHRGALVVGPEAVALHRLEVELHPEPFSRLIPDAVGVAAIHVHEPEALRQPEIGEQDRHLVQALRRQRPVVPRRGVGPQVGARMALLGADEVGELQRIADEEHRRVVADQVPVTLLGVELDRGAAHVAFGVRRDALAGHGAEPDQQVGRPADALEQLGPRIFADVVGDGQCAVGAGAFRVHHALGHPLAVLHRQLFEQHVVLQ